MSYLNGEYAALWRELGQLDELVLREWHGTMFKLWLVRRCDAFQTISSCFSNA